MTTRILVIAIVSLFGVGAIAWLVIAFMEWRKNRPEL